MDIFLKPSCWSVWWPLTASWRASSG